MNEPDAYALEEALRLKEKHGGEVVVCSAGPARVAQVHPRSAGPRRRSRDPRRRRRRSAARTPFDRGRLRWPAAMTDERFDLDPDRSAVRRHGLRADRRRSWPSASGSPHATIIMEVARLATGSGTLRVKRELEGGWFQWVGDAAARRADDSERHQSAPLRDAQRHHGREEEGDQESRRYRRERRALQTIVGLYAPEKAKTDAGHRRLAG